MHPKLQSILEKRRYRYLLTGSLIYFFELAVIVIAQWLGATPVFAVGLSFWLGLFLSFGAQKFLTFGDKRTHHKILVPQIIAFSLLVLFNFGFTVMMAKLLSSLLPAALIRTLALGITTLWNFYLYKTRIFKIDGQLVY